MVWNDHLDFENKETIHSTKVNCAIYSTITQLCIFKGVKNHEFWKVQETSDQ
jgi:hypothetical protein